MSKKKTETVGVVENTPTVKTYRVTIRNLFVTADCSIEAESPQAAVALVKAQLSANVNAAE